MKSRKYLNALIAISVAAAIAGFADATYLVVAHYQGSVLSCSIAQCDKVLASVYSQWGPFPLALFGAAYYFLILAGLVAYIDTRKKLFITVTAYATAVGFAVSLFLMYVQLFVIRFLCLYCVFSAATSTVLFACGMLILKALPQKRSEPD